MGFVKKEITVATRTTSPTAPTVLCASIFSEGTAFTETAAGKTSFTNQFGCGGSGWIGRGWEEKIQHPNSFVNNRFKAML